MYKRVVDNFAVRLIWQFLARAGIGAIRVVALREPRRALLHRSIP
jgi:hypothetical protein